jgi:hypothetical protein
MALIPMKQTIQVRRVGPIGNNGRPTVLPPTDMKARVSEGSRLVRNKDGAEVIASATLYLDKLAEVNVDDKIAYTDELGRVRSWTALTVDVKRDLGGKPLLTEVSVT